MKDPARFQSRGFAEVWGRSYHANAAWIGSGCTITFEAITLRAFDRSHIHLKSDLIELRWIWLPFPYVIVVSRAAGEYRYSTFQMLRWSRLRFAFQSCGYTFTEQSRYYSSRRVKEDVRRYELQDGVPPAPGCAL